jgi:hypothetical protein
VLKRLFFLLLFAGVSCTGVMAQSFMHSVGGTVSVMIGALDQYNEDNSVITRSDLTYFPRYNFVESENSSISVGMPFGAGLSIVKDNYSGQSGLSWGLDFPLVVDYNIGAKSTPDHEGTFGGYFGAGYGYALTSIKFEDDSKIKANSHGPLLRGGFRFGFPSSGTAIGMTVGLYYKMGLETEKFKTFGFNILVDF